MSEDNKTNVGKLYDAMKNKKAPEQGGKPIFAKHVELAKICGAKGVIDIVGKRLNEEDRDGMALPLNFGSKASTGNLPDEVRMSLFGLKKAINDCQLQANIKYRTVVPTAEQIQNTPNFKNVLKPMLKAFDISSFADFLDTVQARFYFEEYELPLLLADEFDQIPMSSPLMRVPGVLGLLEGQLEDDDATFTEQSNTQSSFTVESKNCVTHIKITQDLLDDSSPPIIDKIRKEVLMGNKRAFERALLDGDTTATHQDLDVTSAKDFRKAFKGFRKLAFENEVTTGSTEQIVFDHGGDTASKLLFAKLLKKMKKQNSEKSDLIYVMGNTISTDVITGAIPELFTYFSTGMQSSNITGEMPPIFGIKSVESGKVREDLQATGVASATPTSDTKTYVLLIQKSRFAQFIRQAARVFASPSLPSSDHFLMTSKTRSSFAGNPQSADERSVIMAINVETAT